MEEFLQLAREVHADLPQQLDDEETWSCYNRSALLDDSSSGIIFPTGENLPPSTLNTSKKNNRTEVEPNAISSTMSGSITISSSPPLETGMIAEVSLHIDEQDNFYQHPAETGQMTRCLPSNLPSSGQLKSTGCLPSPLLAAYPVQDLGNSMSAQRMNREQFANESRFCETPPSNRGLDYFPDFGDAIERFLLPYANDSPIANITGQVKQELPSLFSAPDLAILAGGPVSVSVTPPPAEKKKTSTCKVVGDRVYVKLNKSFWLKFCGSEDALGDTEICLETSYMEPDNRDTPVRACGMHGDLHARTCSGEHQKQLAFLCTDGLVPVLDKYDLNRSRSYTPLSGIIGHKLERVAPGVWAFNLKTTALCWNSCHQHKDNGKNVVLTISMRSKTSHMAERSCEFGVTCCESPTRDSKPPVRKRRRISSSSTVCYPINIPNSPNSHINIPNSPINIPNRPINIPDSPSCLMSPRSQSSSPASSSSCEETSALVKNFTVRMPMLSSEEARRVYELLMNMGIKCSLMEHRTDI